MAFDAGFLHSPSFPSPQASFASTYPHRQHQPRFPAISNSSSVLEVPSNYVVTLSTLPPASGPGVTPIPLPSANCTAGIGHVPGTVGYQNAMTPVIERPSASWPPGQMNSLPSGLAAGSAPSYWIYGLMQPPTCWPPAGVSPISMPVTSPGRRFAPAISPTAVSAENANWSKGDQLCSRCRAEINAVGDDPLDVSGSDKPNADLAQDEYMYRYERPPRRHCACADNSCIVNQNQTRPNSKGKSHTRSHYSCKTATRILTTWVREHQGKPYPEREEKLKLAKETNMTLRQLQDWFGNARRRLKRHAKPAARRSSGSGSPSNPDLSPAQSPATFSTCSVKYSDSFEMDDENTPLRESISPTDSVSSTRTSSGSSVAFIASAPNLIQHPTRDQ